jgi:hypothetical protein
LLNLGPSLEKLVILVDLKGCQDLNRIRAEGIKACANSDKDSKRRDGQAHGEDILGLVTIGQIAKWGETHKEYNSK